MNNIELAKAHGAATQEYFAHCLLMTVQQLDAYSEAVRADERARGVTAPEQHEKEMLELIAQRDHGEEIIDALCEAVLGENQKEWSSAYYFEDAVTDVQERIEELEVRAGCRESNAAPQAPKPPAAMVPLTDGQIAEIWRLTNIEVANLEAHDRYTFGAWLPIAIRLTVAAHGIGTQGAQEGNK